LPVKIPWTSHLKEPWALSPILGGSPWVLMLLGLPILSALSRSGDEVVWAQIFSLLFFVCSLGGGILGIYFGRKGKITAQDKVHRLAARAGWVLGILDVSLLLLCSMKVPNDARMARHDKEEKVKAVAYKIDLTLREYQQTHAGLKPNPLGVLEAMLPDSVKITHNPFVPLQSYNLYTGGLVDREPHGPGQIGYIFKGQDNPYQVIANGWRGQVLVLEEARK
jgi:hypothetical protein